MHLRTSSETLGEMVNLGQMDIATFDRKTWYLCFPEMVILLSLDLHFSEDCRPTWSSLASARGAAHPAMYAIER